MALKSAPLNERPHGLEGAFHLMSAALEAKKIKSYFNFELSALN